MWTGARWAAWTKGASLTQPLRTTTPERDDTRATVFPRIAARYVDAGAAKVAEIMIPIDGATFTLEPTPVPELSEALEDTSQVTIDKKPQMRPGDPEAGEQEQMPLTVADLAKNQQRMASEAAQEAEDQINDWLVECKHNQALRKAIFDVSRLGTMIVKGPVPATKKSLVVTKDNVDQYIVPGQ